VRFISMCYELYVRLTHQPSGNCEEAFSSTSKMAEELRQSVDVLLLDQYVCQFQNARSQFFDVRKWRTSNRSTRD